MKTLVLIIVALFSLSAISFAQNSNAFKDGAQLTNKQGNVDAPSKKRKKKKHGTSESTQIAI